MFAFHFAALKSKLANQSASIITDKTDCHGLSILNVIASICGESFLMDVVTLRECNHQTLKSSRHLSCSTGGFKGTVAFLTDSVAYCKRKKKKAHKEVLSIVFINGYHALCIDHILNLAGEVFSHWPAFDNVTQLITFIKSALKKKKKKKLDKKTWYLTWFDGSLPREQGKLPPVPMGTSWNSWFNSAKYHSLIVQFYKGFFKQKKKAIALQ